MPKKEPVIFDINWNACLKCGACIAVCHHKLEFTSPFDTIAINKPCYIICMDCEKVCPVSAITHQISHFPKHNS